MLRRRDLSQAERAIVRYAKVWARNAADEVAEASTTTRRRIAGFAMIGMGIVASRRVDQYLLEIGGAMAYGGLHRSRALRGIAEKSRPAARAAAIRMSLEGGYDD